MFPTDTQRPHFTPRLIRTPVHRAGLIVTLVMLAALGATAQRTEAVSRQETAETLAQQSAAPVRKTLNVEPSATPAPSRQGASELLLQGDTSSPAPTRSAASAPISRGDTSAQITEVDWEAARATPGPTLPSASDEASEPDGGAGPIAAPSAAIEPDSSAVGNAPTNLEPDQATSGSGTSNPYTGLSSGSDGLGTSGGAGSTVGSTSGGGTGGSVASGSSPSGGTGPGTPSSGGSTFADATPIVGVPWSENGGASVPEPQPAPNPEAGSTAEPDGQTDAGDGGTSDSDSDRQSTADEIAADEPGGITEIVIAEPTPTPIITPTPGPGPTPTPDPNFINVKDFGAKGDGVTDDYDAIQAAAKVINTKRTGTLYFPPGHYLIDRYAITGPKSNGVRNIAFRNCDQLLVRGENAKIELKGDFHRGPDYFDGRYYRSYARTVMPLAFVNCTNFVVEGFELDGNVDQMTRDANVIEDMGYGVYTSECANYTIRNIYAHHFMTDGILLGATQTKADRNATVENVRCSNNARQGMSIIQLRGGVIRDSVFEDTGRTGGSYAGHDPQAGVDVEPDYDVPTVDVKTGDLVFEGCTFRNNLKSQFLSYDGLEVKDLTLRACTFLQASSTYNRPFIMAVDNGVIEDSTFRMDRVDVGTARMTTTVRGCRFYSSKNGLVSVEDNELLVENNVFIGTHERLLDTYFPYIINPKAVFNANTVYLPPVAYEGNLNKPAVCLQDVRLSSTNTFMVAPGSSRYTVKYGRTSASDGYGEGIPEAN